MIETNGIKLYTAKEVAAMLGTTYSFVLNRVKKGTLPAARIGKSYYISDEGLKEYLTGKTQDATTPSVNGKQTI